MSSESFVDIILNMKKEQKILIVDDSEFQRNLLALQLNQEGFTTATAENGLDALNYLKKCKDLPCLILSDLLMPEVDGFQLCSKVKELYPDIPVIILTVSNNEKNLKKAFLLGASDYLGKPFTLTEVITRVSNVINLKKAEREIFKSKRELEEIFNTAADWMRVIDFDYNVLNVNDSLAKKLNKSKEEIIGKKCYETFPGLNCDTDECTIQRMKRIPKKFDIDVIKQINNINCSCILSVTPFTDGNGRVVGVVENFKDITDRKNAEQILKESEAKYRGLIDFTDTGYLIMDETGKVIDANSEYVRLTGHQNLSEIKGRTVLEWTAEYDLIRNRQEVKKCFEIGNVSALEIDYCDKNGSIINIEIFAKVVTVNGKQQALALCRDITARNKRIKDLKIFKELLDSSNDAIFVINPDDARFIDVNKQAYVSLGYPKEELLKLGVINISRKLPDRNSWKVFLSKFKEKIEQIIEDIHIRKDGTEFPVEVSVRYISYSNKEYFIALARDISDRKRVEEEINNLAKFPEENTNPVLRISNNGNLLYSNPAADKLILDRLSNDSIRLEWLKVIDEVSNTDNKTAMELKIENKIFLFDITPIKDSGYSNVYGVDITERKAAEKTILQVQERLDMTLKGANIGLWDWNIKTGEVFYDDVWCNMLGYRREDLKQHVSTWVSMLHPDDKDNAFKELKKHFADDKYKFSIEFRFKTKSNGWKWMLGKGKVLERDINGNPLRMLGIHLDITERLKIEERIRETNKELEKLAFYDSLTGVISRNAFLDLLDKSIKVHKRQEKKLALLFIDVDKFKNINDLYGHDIGDKVLKYIAKVIRSCIRESDFIGRLGGDEFVVCLKNIELTKGVVQVAQKINQKLVDKVQFGNLKLDIGVSIGVSIFPDDGDSAFILLKYSDLAMYKSKTIKSNGYYIFNHKIADELDFEYELEQAYDKNEYCLNFQKVYNRSGDICCEETLLRWENDKFGTVMPNDFIWILEKNRSFYDVEIWIIEKVCEQIKNTVNSPQVSVNLSHLILEHPNFYNSIVNIFNEYKIDPGKIAFEISERNKSVNVDVVKNVIEKLKQFGVGHIVLDDFGAGHSSFLNLVKLPIDIVKVDHSFIMKLNEPKYYRNVYALVTHLKALDLKVAAKGVETKEQFEILKEMGFDYFQGFYFSRPEKTL